MLADCYDTEQAGLTEKIEQYERERFFSERLLYQKAVQNKAICIPESKSQPLGLQAGTLVIAAEILEIAETTDEIALIIAVVVATSEQGLI